MKPTLQIDAKIMETTGSKIINLVELCAVRKLSKNFEECDSHAEYDYRKTNLTNNFRDLLQVLEETKKYENCGLCPKVLASLLILFYELRSDGEWNAEYSKQYADKLNQHLYILYEISLESLLLQQDNAFNTQDIFSACLASLCKKLNSKALKKYPALIEVYCALLMNTQKSDVNVNPLTALPISLLLIDDYLMENKIKGLKSCNSVLKRLSPEDFEDGNYYEVLYQSLKKTMSEKDTKISNLMSECFLEFTRIVPRRAKESIISEIYSLILEQLNRESNLYRKATLFNLIRHVISLCGVNCVKKKKQFKHVVCENLEVCCTEAVGDVLLHRVLESLSEWLRYSWCIWKFSDDHRLLSILLKVLYMCKEEHTVRLVNVIKTLIKISSLDEQKQVMKSLNKSSQINSDRFQHRIELIKEPSDY